jgi:hypothetical protein
MKLFRNLKRVFNGYDDFEYSAEDARRVSIFGTTDDREVILKRYIREINYLIHLKALEGTRCLVVEMDQSKNELKEEIISHYVTNGYKVKEIKGDDKIDFEMLLIVWS